VRAPREFAGAADLGDTFGLGEESMRLTYALLLLGLAGACSDDDYPTPSGGFDGGGSADASVDAGVDADPLAPDADPLAPDALPPDAEGSDDGRGPLIEVESPEEDQILAGLMVLRFTVTDVDMVDGDSVEAYIQGPDGALLPFTNLEPSGIDEWTATFDTRVLAGRVFPVVHILASDRAGNDSRLGFQITLDNMPPIAELDPPRVRERTIEEGRLICSLSFDPVGGDAPDDGESVAQFIELRARIEDQSNEGRSTSNVIVPLAGIDDTRVELLVLDDTTQPLVVDTDGDGKCDAVNPELTITEFPTQDDEVALVNFGGFEAQGAMPFPQIAVPGDEFVGRNEAEECNYSINGSPPPELLCIAADDAWRITVADGTGAPALYSIVPPEDRIEDACMGDFFDSRGANVEDGWACAVVRSSDTLGNTAVSRVLRFCVDHDQRDANGNPLDPTPECHAWRTTVAEGQRPSCTGTLTGGVVTNTPCTPLYEFERRTNARDYALIDL
jgi:hypothetical protein